MDWSSLKQKLNPILTKLDPYLNQAKDAGLKALDYTQKQIQNTPLVLKTLDEYTSIRASKRVIILAYDETDEGARELLVRFPLWSTQAWSDAAEFRLVEIHKSPDIVRELQVKTPLSQHVWYTGQETFHSTEKDAIIEWWKTRCYDGKTDDTDSKDPISQS